MSTARLSASGGTHWQLAGDLNFSSVPQLWPSLQRLLTADHSVTLSLAGVTHANSAGLVVLLEAVDRARQTGCTLHLSDVPEELLDLARMSNCEAVLGVAN